MPDAPLPGLLERTAPEEADLRNAALRREGRHPEILALFPAPDEVCLPQPSLGCIRVVPVICLREPVLLLGALQ